METKEEKPKKEKKIPGRPPGRPRKNPQKIPLEIEGIVPRPKDKNNLLELYYHDPNHLKKIIQFLHQESVTDINITFYEKEMVWITNDSNLQSKIKLVVDCKKVNRYYCYSNLGFVINFDDLKVVGDKLDSSSYEAIMFIIAKDLKRPTLDFKLETSINISELTLVGITNVLHCENDISKNLKGNDFNKYNDKTLYPLKFELPGKYLKKMILDIKNSSGKKWQIYKLGNKPLIFKYTSENKRVHEERTVNDPKTLKVEHYFNNDTIFSISVFIDYIKPLTSLLTAADSVVIYCSNTAPLIFKIPIENGVFILYVTVNIIDLRNIRTA